MRGPRAGPRPGGPRGSGGQAAFLGGPVPGDPPREVGGAPGQPLGLPRWGPWKPAGSSGPQGGPRDRRGAGPGETREHSAPSGGPERGRGAPQVAGAPLLHPRHLEALRPGGRSAGARLAPQAAQEVADIEKVLVDALVRALCVQVHLEALARQDDGRGVLVGLQDLLWGGGGRGAVTSARRRCLHPTRHDRTPGRSAGGTCAPRPPRCPWPSTHPHWGRPQPCRLHPTPSPTGTALLRAGLHTRNGAPHPQTEPPRRPRT